MAASGSRRISRSVWVMSELAYDGAMQNVPFVVGAPMLADTGYKLPEGMLFTKTRVAGPHPYKGAGRRT